MKRKRPNHLRFRTGTRGGLRANGIPEPRDRPESQAPKPAPGATAENEEQANARDARAIARFFRVVLKKEEES